MFVFTSFSLAFALAAPEKTMKAAARATDVYIKSNLDTFSPINKAASGIESIG